jgi:hypothetical protein
MTALRPHQAQPYPSEMESQVASKLIDLTIAVLMLLRALIDI